jgi:hypothetical protein
MIDRISCCAPFCKRTIGKNKLAYGFSEWLCQKHYGLVDIKLKRRRAALRRRNIKRIDAERYVKTDDRMWARIKKQAIERATGV